MPSRLGSLAAGASVVVGYHTSEAGARETVAEAEKSGWKAIAQKADVTREADIERLIARAKDEFGRLDILVANAGTPTDRTPTTELSSEQWDHGLALNCKSVFFCAKHTIPLLSDRTGRIIVTSSISARTGGGHDQLTYAAAKSALENMVRHWAKELAPRGITVNAIAPGIIRTHIHEVWTPPEAYRKLIEDRIPMGRDGLPADCVGPALLLASDDGSYITGQVIEINGGMLMP